MKADIKTSALGWTTGLVCLTLMFAGCGGGGGSPAPPPPTNNPVPSLTTISPSSTQAGGGPFTLTVNGSNFISSSTVNWNGVLRTTTFNSSIQLTATIASTDIASQGTAQVTVSNPAPGGGTSNAVTFTITPPTPMITSLSPSSAVAGQPGFTLTVNGSNFSSNSVVRWNGSDRVTSFVTSIQLTALIMMGDVASAGTFPVTVATPATPAVVSAPVNLVVTVPQPLAITTTSLPPSATGKNYHFVLAGGGGVPPLTWSLASGGALPAGLTLDGPTGLISGTLSGATSNFTVQLTDFQGSSNSRPLSIQVLASLTRNDNVCVSPNVLGTDQPVPISNGTLRASISPYGDVDTYSFAIPPGTTATNVSIETFAQQLNIGNNLNVRSDFLDTVLELLDGNCNLLALNDDIFIPDSANPGTHIQDSKIVVGPTPFPKVPVPCDPNTSTVSCSDVSAPTSLPAGTYFIRVRDFRGDGRPDLVYDLAVSGVQ